MQALERAIAGRTPVEGLSQRSPMSGLRRRALGRVDVLAQSVAAVAPAGVALTTPSSVYAEAGSFALVATLATITIVVLLAMTISVFTRRLTSTGSLYTFASRGIGRRAGIVAGVALASGYGGIGMATLFDASTRTLAFVAPLSPGIDRSPMVLIGVTLGFGALIAAAIALGVRTSTRVMLVVEALAVLTIATVALIVFAGSGWDTSSLWPDPGDGLDVDAILSGVAVGLVAFIGFESGAALGPETRRPLSTVPRAMGWTVFAVCLSYLIGSSAYALGARTSPLNATSESSDVALATLGEQTGLTGISTVVELIIIVSFFACALATTTALVRLAFVMSREGLLPATLSRTTARRQTPAVGGFVFTAVIAGVPIVWLLVTGSADWVWQGAKITGIIGYFLAYLLVAIAAPAFLLRIGEFQWRAALPALVVAGALAATLVHYLVGTPPDQKLQTLGALALMTVTSTLLITLAHNRRDIALRLGLFDSPIASDSIGGTPPLLNEQTAPQTARRSRSRHERKSPT